MNTGGGGTNRFGVGVADGEKSNCPIDENKKCSFSKWWSEKGWPLLSMSHGKTVGRNM